MAELTEVMRQRDAIHFIDLLNQIRIGDLDTKNEQLLKSRFITKDDPDYPVHSIHIYAENAPVDQYNSEMLDKLPTSNHQVFALDELPKNVRLSNTELEFITNSKPRDTGGLSYSLQLKEGARVISKNIDIDDKLVNGQVGTVMQFKFDQTKIIGVYIKLDDNRAGLKAMTVNVTTRDNNWILIERAESTFNLKKHFSNSPSVRRTQFPLMLSWACTCHKVQGLFNLQ
jgi:PIF1 helicase.